MNREPTATESVAAQLKKDLISRVLTLAAEDFADIADGARISVPPGSVTIYTQAQVNQAFRYLIQKYQQTVDDGVALEDWS